MKLLVAAWLALCLSACGADEHAMHQARGSGMGIDSFGHTVMSEERAAVTPAGYDHTRRLIATLRRELPRYRDVDAALRDGYQKDGPDVPVGALKHFVNYSNARISWKHLDPQRPTAILYRRTKTGYDLAGVMFSAPIESGMDELDRRVPLALGHWHSHRNVCQPHKGRVLTAREANEFGFSGSINTRAACEAAHGVFLENVFGWMVHVYPFEDRTDHQF